MNEMTDDVIHSTQYNLYEVYQKSCLGQFASQTIKTW